MAAWSLYGVFFTHPRTGRSVWGMTTNRKVAIRAAKLYGGEIRRMNYASATHTWDAPTFHVCSDLVQEYPTPCPNPDVPSPDSSQPPS